MTPARILARLVLALGLLLAFAGARAALPEPLLLRLASGDNDEKVAALGEIAVSGDPVALHVLPSGEMLAEQPEDAEDVRVNNRVRNAISAAIAAIQLDAADPAVRLEAARRIRSDATPELLPLIDRALAREQPASIESLLASARARVLVESEDASVRLAAVRTLGESDEAELKQLLLPLLEEGNEPEAAVRAEAKAAIGAINARLQRDEYAGLAFTGLSLGSILLLAALGLAITYGLMGVINMAHGELIMIGAYATYVTQNLVRAWAPGMFEFYPLLAIPVAFTVAALVGVLMERLVIRHLYGRPLETLLATWGISLVLIQSVRSLFGAQNVPIENPQWLSGGVQLMSNLILPWNRIAIIVFAALVVIGMTLILTRTRLGLFVRAVTQNRQMAGCVGVATPRVDTVAFGLGSGIAGLAGCALSQVGNVGPGLGQGYIIDSFMVVVLGGVGQLIGTVYAALGLGVVNKLIEAQAGAVLAKIAVLVIIIVFIQKRPQGLFAVKGRFVEQ
ncbi:MAG: urea ABC transporter permease subunit UrtB [Candidatus Dactylopiibacterium carminicum]|uniref:Urea ABC transporter permease subunit UrtB n=1 Tax=Candidatus Dactylopiibacterium carminicum TaxID=857335 RepID=A0A272EXK8_9RHOO|nr:urea ABC transporter permease subunit UrtB [Candidatus Dactylopiibacterium carminicum]KAF7600206.1 urea ABC transporter permease subunit UrtB [Candidatus Dactylopiibacterium carminicum]PAS94776.1 MAG: urea ABC transporter permease subunit UrtB [Candidatus Dactylopiibacterium carminicum]PAT00204.1 MAG: urea ABC transporter permease subunit UrtB [Candidatus Dactylopiibacterium carminicum]